MVDVIGTYMQETARTQRWKIEDAADDLAHMEGVEEAKAELERVAQQLDQ